MVPFTYLIFEYGLAHNSNNNNVFEFYSFLTAIKTGRYTLTKRTQYITEIKTLEGGGHSKSNPQEPLISSSSANKDTVNAIPCLTTKHSKVDGFSPIACKNSDTEPSGISTSTSTGLITGGKRTNKSSKVKDTTLVPLDKDNAELLHGLLKLQAEFVEDLDSFLDQEKMTKAQMEYAVSNAVTSEIFAGFQFLRRFQFSKIVLKDMFATLKVRGRDNHLHQLTTW